MNCNLIEIAASQYGIKEIIGEKHNPEVLKYFQEIGHKWVYNDELAWCAAFVNWCLLKSGFEHTGKLNARSFLDIGEAVKNPQFFDLVVLWRIKPDSEYGHVGFFYNFTPEGKINLYGGNQRNQVCIMPYSENRLLSYRRLSLAA